MISVMMPSDAFGADKQAGKLVRSDVLDGLAAEPHFVAIRQHHFHAHHVVLGHSVFQAAQSAGIFGHRSAHGRGVDRAGVGRIDQAVRLDRDIELLDHDAGLDRGRQILGIYLDDPVHSLERENDAAPQGNCPAAQVGARAARIDCDIAVARQVHDLANFLRVGRHDHNIGNLPRHVGSCIVAVGDQVDFAGQEVAGSYDCLKLFDNRSIQHRDSSG